jgi:hypothetical protein
MIKFILTAIFLLTPITVLAQSAGTINLPTAQGSITPGVLNSAVNGQMTTKFDYASVGPLATVAGSSSAAAIVTAGGIASSTIGQPNGIAALGSNAGLQAPTTSILGGVLASTAVGTNQFMTGITTAGAPIFAQPSFGNLSGTAASSQLPLATNSTLGGVSVSTGLNVSSGALSVNYGTSAGTAATGNDSRLTNDCYTTGCTFTGAITPSTTNGIVGTTSGNTANAGSVGEELSSAANSVAMTTNTYMNLGSLVLTPGDWYVTGEIREICSSSNMLNVIGGVTTSSNTGPPFGQNFQIWPNQGTNTVGQPIPATRFNVSANTTIYAVAYQYCTSGTLTGSYGLIATRLR